MCNVAGLALNDSDLILKTLYGLRSTSARINTADTLMQPAFRAVGMANEQAKALTAVRYCVRIRNQYAHCNWGNKPAGLCFADLQKSAKWGIMVPHWRHIDVPLLAAQEAYFGHARHLLFYLEHELAVRRGNACNPTPFQFPQKVPHRRSIMLQEGINGRRRTQKKIVKASVL